MEKSFIMTEKDIDRNNLLLKASEKSMKQVKAAQLLGVSERHFRRLLKAYKEKGAEGLISKKKGMQNRLMKPEIRAFIIDKLKTTYKDCGPTFAYQKITREHKIKVSLETVRQIMIEEGLWESRKRRHLRIHQRRDRREAEGELIQIDGSPHAWFEDRGLKCSLLAFIDDATSKIKHLKFVGSESTKSYFLAFRDYLKKHGKPQAFYSDRFSVFRVNNDKEGYRKEGLTEIGRALKEMKVLLICANSPQAKGRVERLFCTLQDRLVKEMRLRGISSIEEGNEYLEEYIKEHNELFSVKACIEEDAHTAVTDEEIEASLCYKTTRKLTKNLELSYDSRILQIQIEETGYRLIGAQVTVKEALEGDIAIEYQGELLKWKELLVKDQQGNIKNKKEILFAELGMQTKQSQKNAS
jgi:transposase